MLGPLYTPPPLPPPPFKWSLVKIEKAIKGEFRDWDSIFPQNEMNSILNPLHLMWLHKDIEEN